MKQLIYFYILGLVLFIAIQPAYAFLSPHPVQLYDKGEALIADYQGDINVLVAAQDVLLVLIEKYPHSPFGYLGMSHLYRIDAYLGNENYDLKLIRERALPFALKALELGPSIRAVHENYAFFEEFFHDEKTPGSP